MTTPVRMLTALLIAVITPQSCFADIVVLWNQRQYQGTVANRAAFAADPAGAEVVSLLTDRADADSTGLLRFAAADIEYVVLEDGSDRQVIDMRTVRAATRARVPASAGSLGADVAQTPQVRANRVAGGILAATGILAIAVGLGFKFGDPKLTMSGGALRYEESSYNGANYALMIGGGVFCVAGTVLAASSGGRVAARAEPAGLYLGTAVHF